MASPYTHDLRRAFPGSKSPYRRALAALGPALKKLKVAYEERTLPLLRVPSRRDDLADIAAVARRFRARFADVVVLGTGGSSLGAQTLVVAALAAAGAISLAGQLRLWWWRQKWGGR